jgi:hypothetical protein
MSTNPLSLNDVASITLNVSSGPVATPSYNVPLFIDNSPVITNAQRVAAFDSPAAMLTFGYSETNPAYLAALAAFAVANPPASFYAGLQDTTAVSTVTLGGAAGTGYVVGDILTIVQGQASGATVRVTTIGAEGAITAVTLLTQGTGYTAASNLATTGGTGTGAEIDITAIGETALQAVTACRQVNSVWYSAYVCGAAKADILAIAPFIESATVPSQFFFNTADTDVPAGTAGNVFLTLQSAMYKRTFGIYSTTQSGSFPGNAYAGAAMAGLAAGLSTGLPGSYTSLGLKQLAGIAPEPIDATAYANIKAANGNVYVTQGTNSQFTLLQRGTASSGQYWDQTFQRDLLCSSLQDAMVETLIAGVTQTNSDQQLLIAAANSALETSAGIGYIAPGTWAGAQLLTIAPGTPLPTGYIAQSAKFTTPKPANRAMMPVVIGIIEAGVGQSVAVTVNVQV